MADAQTATGTPEATPGVAQSEPNEPDPDASPLDPLLIAGALGILGPILMLVLSVPVLLADRVFELPLLVVLALGLIAGQYLAFGGLALGYLRSRGLDWAGVRSYLGVSVPGIREIFVVLGGWLGIFIMVLVIGAIIQALGTETASNQNAVTAFENPEIIPALIVAMFLVVGPSEEILYRGVVQGRMREHFGPAISIGVASAVFAAVHFVALSGGGSARLVTVAILFFPSLVFGAVYEYTDNLVVPALVHGLHNAVIFAMLYVVAVYGPEMSEMEGMGAEAVLAAVPF